jgi:hypothetical protein
LEALFAVREPADDQERQLPVPAGVLDGRQTARVRRHLCHACAASCSEGAALLVRGGAPLLTEDGQQAAKKETAADQASDCTSITLFSLTQGGTESRIASCFAAGRILRLCSRHAI